VIRLENVTKTYRTTDRDTITALQSIDLTIEAGEMVAITGPSGSGTSTLMNVLSCLDLPSDGRYLLDGTDVGRLSKRALAKIRGRKIGFVFQSFKLIPNSNVQLNVELPLLYTRAKVRRQRARVALDRVGLRGHYDDNPVELFAAQQQKAVIARALINDPAILLDDEPTADLDADSALEIMELFTELNEAGCTIVYSTHDEDTVAYAQRVVRLKAGRIVSDRANRARRVPRHNPPKLRAV
jgi:putative ABC transport system ATP-binding protein